MVGSTHETTSMYCRIPILVAVPASPPKNPSLNTKSRSVRKIRSVEAWPTPMLRAWRWNTTPLSSTNKYRKAAAMADLPFSQKISGSDRSRQLDDRWPWRIVVGKECQPINDPGFEAVSRMESTTVMSSTVYCSASHGRRICCRFHAGVGGLAFRTFWVGIGAKAFPHCVRPKEVLTTFGQPVSCDKLLYS